MASAQRTDVLVLKNGDHVTGEIKKLRQGILEFKTDHMGTLKVEWPAVRRMTSTTDFEIKLSDGRRIYGALDSSAPEDRLQIVGESKTPALSSVVELAPLKESFMSQINGSLDVGYNFAQSNTASTWNANAKASYRTQNYLTAIGYSSYLNAQENAERTTRNMLTATTTRLLSKRWGILALGQLLQSSQLGVGLRTTLGGGVVSRIVQSNRMSLTPVLGTVYSRSNFSDGAPDRSDLLLLTGIQYDLFTFGSHKTNIGTSFFFLPSLTQSGHIRLELDSNLRVKLFRDFYWSLNVFDNFDNA